jgi:hypothetical protein
LIFLGLISTLASVGSIKENGFLVSQEENKTTIISKYIFTKILFKTARINFLSNTNLLLYVLNHKAFNKKFIKSNKQLEGSN